RSLPERGLRRRLAGGFPESRNCHPQPGPSPGRVHDGEPRFHSALPANAECSKTANADFRSVHRFDWSPRNHDSPNCGGTERFSSHPIMLQSLPNPEPGISAGEPRNRWAVIDLMVFGFFFLVMLIVIAPLARLPVIYAILLQGVFNIAVVSFIAGWIRMVRRSCFVEYIHFFRNRTFSFWSF